MTTKYRANVLGALNSTTWIGPTDIAKKIAVGVGQDLAWARAKGSSALNPTLKALVAEGLVEKQHGGKYRLKVKS